MMFKTIRDMLAGALVAAAVGSAPALVGQVPVPGFQAIDGNWLLGLAGGSNFSYQYGLAAAGTSQAAATLLPANTYIMEVDTASGSATGVAMPFCTPGLSNVLYNNTGTNLTVYPNVANNPATGTQDTINNGATLTLNAHTQISFACGKAGVWSAS